MGKCASKDVAGGQAVAPDMENAGSPVFAPEAPVVSAEAAENNEAGGEVSFQGYSQAPVEPVAAGVPLDQGYGGAVAEPFYPPTQEFYHKPAEYPQPSEPVYHQAGPSYAHPGHAVGYPSQVRTERVFATLEEAEASARALNEKYGVEHVAYNNESWQNAHHTTGFDAGMTYAQAYAPASPEQKYTEAPRPAERLHYEEAPRPQYEEAPRPQYEEPRAAQYEEPRAEQYEERRASQYEERRASQHEEAASPVEAPASYEPAAVPAEPVPTPAVEPEAPPAKAEKKKKKKKNAWAW